MKIFKNLMDYFNLNQKANYGLINLPSPPKPKPIQKKKEKKPFPYYRLVTTWDDATDYQCLACKAVFSIGFNPTNLKFCPTCGIEFEGQFTKKNPRYNQWNTKFPPFKPSYIKVILKGYNRKNIINKKSDKNMFSIGFGDGIEPITQERLEYTKDKDNYYKWEDLSSDYIYPFGCNTPKYVWNNMLNHIKYYKKENKILQIWAGPKGKEKLIKEIVGDDNPYPVGYGQIVCSGIMYYPVGVSG